MTARLTSAGPWALAAPAKRTTNNTASLIMRMQPGRHVVEEIFHRIRILARSLLARRARRKEVRGALDHDEVFVLCFGKVVLAFDVTHEIMRAHRGEELGNGDRLDRA